MYRDGQNNHHDPRYMEPTFQQYCSDPQAPKSVTSLIFAGIKARIGGAVRNMPRLLLTLVLFTILTTIFNVYFWSVINDTMWAGSGQWGRISFIPYLIGGAVYSGSRYKGVTPFEARGVTPTGRAVVPLTLGLSLLFSRLVVRKKQAGPGAVSRDFANVKNIKEHYEKELMVHNAGNPSASTDYADLSNLHNNKYMQIGFCCAVVFGFFIRNPFAVPVFAILLYFSFGQGGESDIGQMIFRARSADSRLHNGSKKTVPRYAENMLVMYYMSIGLFLYTAVNIVLWFFFDYNYWFRLIVSIALIAAIFVLGGGNKKQAASMMTMILFVAGGAILLNGIAVFADDNGWSESGKTIGGLIHNNGFPKSLWSSFLPALAWDIGMLLGWPLTDTIPPAFMDMPVSPEPSQPENPYDFPERPREWSLNEEGDVSYIDPVTGKQRTFGLVGYDEDGKPRFIGETGTYYDLDEMLLNYENAKSNPDYFRDANKGLDEWLARQRAENQKLSRDGMQYLEEKWRREAEQAKEEREADQLFKLWVQYGGELDNKESIRAAVEKAVGKASLDAEHYAKVADRWDTATKIAETTEKVADYSLTALSAVTGNKTIKKAYDLTKKYASKMSEAYADGKSVKMAFLSTSVENLIDYASGGIGETKWHYTVKMMGSAGAEMSKKIWSNLENGEDWKKGLETAAFNGMVEYTSGSIGESSGWKMTASVTGESAKKIWSNLDEGKNWNDDLGSTALSGVVKGSIDKVTDMINENQKEITKDSFKRDVAYMKDAETKDSAKRMSAKGLDALNDLKCTTLANNKEAEKAVAAINAVTNKATKEAYDGIVKEMGKYNRDFDAEEREAFLKEVDNRKALEVERKKQEAEKARNDARNAIRQNAQKPL